MVPVVQVNQDAATLTFILQSSTYFIENYQKN